MKTSRHYLVIFLLLIFSGSASRLLAQGCQASFSFTIDSTVSPNVISFVDNSTAGAGMITSWQWNYNGVPFSNMQNPILTQTPSSWDVICLSITTDSGCQSTWCDTISPCQVTLSFTYTSDSLGNYTFTPVMGGGWSLPVTFMWIANNGTTSTQSTFTTNFSVNGVYSVCLYVADMNGCNASFCDAITVTNGVDCEGCTPHLYYAVDSLNPPGIIFYDTTTYIATPDSDYWLINGNYSGPGQSIGSTFPPGTLVNACHVVSVPGCSALCSDNTCISVQTPGIAIDHFYSDTTTVFCTAPQSVAFNFVGHIYSYPPGDTTIGVHISFGDGTDTSFLVVQWQNYFNGYLSHEYQNPGNYACQLIVYSPDSVYSDTLTFSPVVITNSCGPLSGHVYQDMNSNCIFDTGDVPVRGQAVSLANGAGIYRIVYTDSSGFYAFNVPTGQTYTITYLPSSSWHVGNFITLCPAGGSMSVSTVPSFANDFFLECPAGFDLTGTLYGWGFVPGRNGFVCVYPRDILGCSPPVGQVQVILDPLWTPVPSPNYTINGDTVTWNISQLNGYFQSACIQVITDSTAVPGDMVCVTVNFLPVAGDSVPSNNTLTYCWAVRTSWDPNDKAAEPEGAGASHAIRPGTELTYTIRFQNTGTASAQDIYILDSLDASLDVSTLKILATSHPMEPAVLSGNTLRFTYANINLPDSGTNEPMSHGYVTYSISPLSNVPHGTVIENTAGIYFDYNPVVRTNTTSHTIDFFLSVHQPQPGNRLVTLYPNPASNKLNVQLLQPGRAEVKLYDVTGRLVLHSSLNASGTIDVHPLKSATYQVQVIQNGAVQNSVLVLTK